MTKQERLKAFEMRLNGRNWSEIGRELGYSSTAVRDDLLLCVSARPHQVTCVYPEIRDIITDKYGGSVSAFARECGISYGTMYYALSGKRPPRSEIQRKICAAINMPPEQAFRRNSDDE